MKKFIAFLLTLFIVFGITIIFNIDERKGAVYLNKSTENGVMFVSVKAGIVETIGTAGYGRAKVEKQTFTEWLDFFKEVNKDLAPQPIAIIIPFKEGK